MLAGGRSSRFGSDKLAAEREGVPLLHHAVLRVAEVADDVVVVLAPGASGAGLPPGVRVANDPTEGEGPLAGLHAGLLAAVRSDVAIVVAGDMPDIQPDVIREMLRVLEESGADAVALQDGADRRVRSPSRCARGRPPTRSTPCCTPAGGGSATCSGRSGRR